MGNLGGSLYYGYKFVPGSCGKRYFCRMSAQRRSITGGGVVLAGGVWCDEICDEIW